MIRKKILELVVLFVIGIVGGIFADQIFWPYFIEKPLFNEYRLEKNPIYVTEKEEITILENEALEERIGQLENVIVGVKTITESGKILEGSGLIVTSDGLFVVLNDLIPKGSNFGFYIYGKRVDYQILKRDSKENLALVRVEGSNLPTVNFASFSKLKIGKRVFLIGTIFEKNAVKKVVNVGIVKHFNTNVIQTNIIESEKLAGSSLFDIEGNMWGINEISDSGQVNAIPISKIRSFIGF